MKHILATILLVIASAIHAHAQKTPAHTLTGQVKDSASREPIEAATISLISPTDSSLIAYTVTDKSGKFSFKNLRTPTYLLTVSHTGYKTTFHKSTTKAFEIYLARSADLLEEVTVTAPPVQIKKDTVEFNAAAFRMPPNSVAEDLLKKLPGIQVDKNGEIKIQGETINKVYVDGKEFFGNDPKIATKNLTTDMIASIQVFDDMSEQAKFTRMDDGSRKKSLNIKLKKDKQMGYFGRVLTGTGISEDDQSARYESSIALNRFKNNTRISLIGSANNINSQHFGGINPAMMAGRGNRGFAATMMGAGGSGTSGMGSIGNAASAGIARLFSSGINYSDKWNDFADIAGSYFFSNTRSRAKTYSSRNTNLSTSQTTDTFAIQNESSASDNQSANHSFNLKFEADIDSLNSIIYIPAITIQAATSQAHQYDSVLRFSPSTGATYLSNIFSNTVSSEQRGSNIGNNIIYRRRFRRFGRTFFLNINHTLNNTSTETKTFAPIKSYDTNNKLVQDSLQHFAASQQTKSSATSINASYNEPIGKYNFIEINYTYSHANSNSDKKAFDYDSTTGKYQEINLAQTNYFDNASTAHRGGVNYRYQKNKINIQVGGAAEYSTIENQTIRPLTDADTTIVQHFLNFQPIARMALNLERSKHLNVSYSGRTNQPSVTQLQDAPHFTNQFIVTNGNPFLRQEYTNQVTVNYASFNLARFGYFNAALNFSNTLNKIVNNADTLPERFKTFNTTPGAQYIVPVNLDGSFNISLHLALGIPLGHAMKGSSINFGNAVMYNRNAAILNSNQYFNLTVTVTQSAGINLALGDVDLGLRASVTYNSVNYSGRIATNAQRYFTQSYSSDINYRFLKRYIFRSDFDYFISTGRGEGFNQQVPLWNTSIAMQVFKNRKGECKLSVNDVLNQNQQIKRTVADNYIQDTRTNILRRYFMLTFTYNLMKAGI